MWVLCGKRQIGGQLLERGQCVGDQAFGSSRRATRSLAQALGHDHRRRVLGGERGQYGVQATGPGVSVTRALLAVAMNLDDRVIDIDHHPVSYTHLTLPTTTLCRSRW